MLNDVDSTDRDVFKVLTGCRNQPRKGEVFCEQCLADFYVKYACGDNSSAFLEAIYPLGNTTTVRAPRRGDTMPRKNPGPE